MTILNTEEVPMILEHLMIVYCTVYRLIRSVTLVKSIGSAKPGKARVINFKARAKPKARALKKGGLFSITTYKPACNTYFVSILLICDSFIITF